MYSNKYLMKQIWQSNTKFAVLQSNLFCNYFCKAHLSRSIYKLLMGGGSTRFP